MRLEFSHDAESDLESILDHIAQDSRKQAIKIVLELRRKCFEILEMPLGFPIVQRYERQGVRRRVVRNYLIFYRIDGDVLVILHILHGARDYEQILSPDE